ncbi:MAG: hypothetical protein HYU37_16655 [Acidobacteria bacterium]|nr:hypothetical protein [Acidobacteriota bacterium]
MGRRTLAIVLLGCASSAGLQAQAAVEDAAKGAALLADARQALGGEPRLAAVKALDVRGEFKRLVAQTTIEGELQIRIERPDKWRRDEDLSPPGGGPAIIRTEVLNGSTVWEENSGRGGFFVGGFGGRGGGRRGGDIGGGGAGTGADPGRGTVDPAQIEAAQRRAWQAELARVLLAWLLVVDGPVTWVGTAEAPDGRADVLEITPSAGPVTRLFLDQSSHLPLMITWQGAAPQLFIAGRRGGARGDGGPPPARGGQPATLQMTLTDYKIVNGIRLPHLITRGVNDMSTEEWTIDSYRINPTFRADVFTK